MNSSYSQVRRLQRGPAPSYFMPIAGLDQERAHAALAQLREAARTLDVSYHFSSVVFLAETIGVSVR